MQTQKESQISDEDIPVVINEILPNPSPNNKEWVELYNPSDKTIDLSGFIIDDILGSGASPYVIPTNTFIGAYGYLVFEFNSVFN
ncbi:MAG: lamin tail domain-containing protein, partial [Bacilli bacterium]|nr:lamin tail domain-containing protein [Bacilli bacterium]